MYIIQQNDIELEEADLIVRKLSTDPATSHIHISSIVITSDMIGKELIAHIQPTPSGNFRITWITQ
jgi:hypothetical protein